MNSENQCSKYDEHSQLARIINFRLPHSFRRMGMFCACAVMAFLLGYKFYGGSDMLIKDICRHLMLLLLLLATLAKDPLEDEYVERIRFQSYVLAFVCAVTYSVVLPLVVLILDVFITKVTGDGSVNFHEVSAFEVMFMLVSFQLLFFAGLKRLDRAE